MMKQVRLLTADWCLRLALRIGGKHWSHDTLSAYDMPVKSVQQDLHWDELRS